MATCKKRTIFQTIISIIMISKTSAIVQPCVESIRDGLQTAFCDSKGHTTIPQNLNPNTEVLSISTNNLEYIKKSDFKRYPKLKKLTYSNIDRRPHVPTTQIEPDALTDLTNLIYVFFNDNDFNRTIITFPKTVRQLGMAHVRLYDNMTTFVNLENLEMLWLHNNFLTKLPKLHPYAPLEDLTLYQNNITSFSTLSIAGYCHLKRLALSIDTIPNFLNEKCECPRLKQWITENEIHGVVPTKFTCKSTDKCKEGIITKKMQKLRENCVLSIRPKFNWMLFVLLPILLAVILFAIVLVGYSVYKKLQELEEAAKNEPPLEVIPVTEPEENPEEAAEEEETSEE